MQDEHLGEERALHLCLYIFFFSRKRKSPSFFVQHQTTYGTTRHGAVLQDNSYTRLHQHRLASSSCYSFQKNALIAYLLYTYSRVFWTNKEIKNRISVNAASGNWISQFPVYVQILPSKRESRPELETPSTIKIAWCMFIPADAISCAWLHELQRDYCKHCKIRVFTYTTGIFRRISEQRYRHTEMAIPATKFWYRRLLSLLGIKADFKTFVISNTRYDSCI
jgi:hypothetical protein